ncbi:hypothetical protein [Streptomyces flavofungini]|uniref:Uncharacterized protein n=1 Tax=Streptomyces flavofungini TaxID=68200 RepID=A0ABS0XAE7_9ACTN|nr:hypothetical protein [Streptomyces flavofungini]MBJ3810194.1 hypothetical protein [Streptomyces flavofungini]GHC82084.1 hypothetical protein GCM10010349_65780 [Streptomyces flavofungini]
MTAHSRTPMPSFSPTVFELLPHARPGIGQGDLAKAVGAAVSRARRARDTDREHALKAVHDAARTPADTLVSELLTPPLAPSAAPKGPAAK